jgi:hypothetical protein
MATTDNREMWRQIGERLAEQVDGWDTDLDGNVACSLPLVVDEMSGVYLIADTESDREVLYQALRRHGYYASRFGSCAIEVHT